MYTFSNYNGGQSGTGKFQLDLTMNRDGSFATEQNAKAVTSIGEHIFFSLQFRPSISNVVFTINGM